MKRLILTMVAGFLATLTFAAQCEGKTQKGARCKREAAEGSRYCIGHASQAKETTAKLKDDGTCWAITEAGARCKHKKDGESDYCKQHGPDVKAKKPGGKCRALTWEGSRCTRDAEADFLYCKQHRKQPTTQKKTTDNAQPATKSASKTQQKGSTGKQKRKE